MPKEGEQKVEKKENTLQANDGEQILISKDKREEEFYFAPTKSKQSKKGKSKAKEEGNGIKHNMETFRLFDQLKLDAPITTADIPSCLEKLDEQMKSYEAKVAAWEEKR